MTVADIPATDGAPDQGTEGIRFMGYTLYDPLIMWDLSSATEPAKLVPGLATKWYQDPADPTKWIFELRQGVKFHDGSTFNADAVIFSLDRALDDKSPAFDRVGRNVLIASLWPIVGLQEDRRLQGRDADQGRRHDDALAAQPLHDRQPRQLREGRQGLAGLSQVAVGHRPVEDEGVDAARARRARAQHRLLEQGPHPQDRAHGAAADPRRLDPHGGAAVRAASTGSNRPRPISLDKLKAGGCKIETNAIPHMWPYTLSMVPGAPTADIRVRKALNLAIDRDAMVKLLGGLAVPAVGCVPPDHPWFGTPSFKIKYDPAEAKKLMAEAGYGPAKRLKIKVAISTAGSGQMYPLIMNEFIQQQFAEIGVDLEFQVMDWNALLNLMRLGAKSPEGMQLAAINSSWNTMDPHNAFMRFVDSQQIPPKGSNWGYINDPGVRQAGRPRRAAPPIRRNSTRCWPRSTPAWSTRRCSCGSSTTCGRTPSRQQGQGLRPPQELVRRLLTGDGGLSAPPHPTRSGVAGMSRCVDAGMRAGRRPQHRGWRP